MKEQANSNVSFMSEKEGLSRRQCQRIVGKAYKVLVADLEEIDIDRKEMVSQLIVNLQSGIQKALQLGNSSTDYLYLNYSYTYSYTYISFFHI